MTRAENLAENCLDGLKEIFDEPARLAFASYLAAAELNYEELYQRSPATLRFVILNDLLSTLGVDETLIERCKRQIAAPAAPMVSLRRN